MSAVIIAIWHETYACRAAIHRALLTSRCDLRVTKSASGPVGAQVIRIDGECACRDFLIDMVVECHQLLSRRSGELHNPIGAARVHVRLRAAPDWIRQRRTAMGAQARADRIRTGARARGLPDEFHRALLEYLVEEAGSMAVLEDHHELARRLASRCTGEFGGAPEHYLDRVVEGMAVVERQCRSGPRVNAGTAECPEYVTWWERYIERPLGRRPRRTTRAIATLPDGIADPNSGCGLGPIDAGSAEADDRVIAILVETHRDRPEAPAEALRTGIAALVEHGLLAEGPAAVLLSDVSRLTSAARQLSAMC
ncbi:hypothetical protein [Actinokineospora pegani]|uniref:hypothetical protein n=1 Tax=Actinokineospora pegani TaxID=2654637 RepID=UPI0012E9B4CB|nr:hypothetical protein [Actinokineospora pegani]